MFCILCIINSFLIKEIKAKSDLEYRKIRVREVQTIIHRKVGGNSIAIIDSNNDEFRITNKENHCLTHYLKTILKPNDLITVGYIQDFSFTGFILPYYETYSISKNDVDFIDFNCISKESRFGKWKITVLLIFFNVAMFYLLHVTQSKEKE